jgi:mercuric ion transport protein
MEVNIFLFKGIYVPTTRLISHKFSKNGLPRHLAIITQTTMPNFIQRKIHTEVIRLGERFSFLSIVIATLACASCFPALAGVGAALGMGFLSQWEGIILEWIPVLAILSIIFQFFGAMAHKHWRRMYLAMLGPALILVAFILFTFDTRAIYLFYVSLGLMLLVSIWDIVNPPKMNKTQPCCPPNEQDNTTTQ